MLAENLIGGLLLEDTCVKAAEFPYDHKQMQVLSTYHIVPSLYTMNKHPLLGQVGARQGL